MMRVASGLIGSRKELWQKSPTQATTGGRLQGSRVGCHLGRMISCFSQEGPMLLVREIMFCKPGKTRPMVDKFRSLGKVIEAHHLGKLRVLTDVSSEGYWMVVAEMEVP